MPIQTFTKINTYYYTTQNNLRLLNVLVIS